MLKRILFKDFCFVLVFFRLVGGYPYYLEGTKARPSTFWFYWSCFVIVMIGSYSLMIQGVVLFHLLTFHSIFTIIQVAMFMNFSFIMLTTYISSFLRCNLLRRFFCKLLKIARNESWLLIFGFVSATTFFIATYSIQTKSFFPGGSIILDSFHVWCINNYLISVYLPYDVLFEKKN